MKEAIIIEDHKAVLDDFTYECPHCGGHFKVDATFLEQVQDQVTCMYCGILIEIPEP